MYEKKNLSLITNFRPVRRMVTGMGLGCCCRWERKGRGKFCRARLAKFATHPTAALVSAPDRPLPRPSSRNELDGEASSKRTRRVLAFTVRQPASDAATEKAHDQSETTA